MTARLLGIGTATPTGRINQAAAAEMIAAIGGVRATRARAMARLYEHTGIERRAMAILDGPHQTLYDGAVPDTAARMRTFHELAPPLAHRACANALQDANSDPSRITHIVSASCTGLASPGVDITLIESLGLPPSTQRINIGFMGCHAAINALRSARAIALAEPEARVLVCCVELCSLHIQAAQEDGCPIADALFADGAAACVVGQGKHGVALRHTASILLPDSYDAMGWIIGPTGFSMGLSPMVPDILACHARPWIENLLAGQGLAISDIASWAIHPGGPRVLESVAKSIRLSERATEISASVLRDHGNMSSATILFILERLRGRDMITPAVALAFGPGLTGEALVLS